MLEVKDQADVQLRDLEVVDHLGYLVVSDRFDDLCVDNDRIEGDQIGNVLTNIDGLVNDGKSGLLTVRDILMGELDDHRIFVRLFQQPMSKSVEHLEGTTDDSVRFLLEQEGFVSVHSVAPNSLTTDGPPV